MLILVENKINIVIIVTVLKLAKYLITYDGVFTMNVLLLGNGFDLYQNLPTKYADFLYTVDYLQKNYNVDFKYVGDIFSNKELQNNDNNIEKCYFANQEEFNKALLNDKKVREIIELTKDNKWFSYFFKSLNEDISWIDFEKEINMVLQAFRELLSSENLRFNINDVCSNRGYSYIIRFFDFTKYWGRDYSDKIEYHTVYNKYVLEYPLHSEHYIINKDKIVSELLNDLSDLAKALDLYLQCFVESVSDILADNRNVDKEDIFNNFHAAVIFNYTNTFEKLYSCNQCFHIHGNVNGDIVLGTNPDKSDELETIDTLFLQFKKYFQRTLFETDSEYLNFISDIKMDKTQLNLVVMGHSLDITDNDIITELFDCAVKITVLYHDNIAKSSYIKNLINIFGKTGFDELRRYKKLTFESLNNDLSVLNYELKSNEYSPYEKFIKKLI